jgi:hypothetical protein
MLRTFKDPELKDYFFDTDDQQVYSKKRVGPAYALKWCVPQHQVFRSSVTKVARVNLSTKLGKVSMTLEQVLNGLVQCTVVAPTKVVNVAGIPLNDAQVQLDSIAPTFEYVMFDTSKKVSQYFYAGTTISAAIALFARRAVIVNPSDIQILNVATGKITKLTIKTVETYALS